MAVAYCENPTTNSRDTSFLRESKTPVVCKKYTPMNDHDVKINKAVFDLLSREESTEKWQDVDDTVSGLGEDEVRTESETYRLVVWNRHADIGQSSVGMQKIFGPKYGNFYKKRKNC